MPTREAGNVIKPRLYTRTERALAGKPHVCLCVCVTAEHRAGFARAYYIANTRFHRNPTFRRSAFYRARYLQSPPAVYEATRKRLAISG